MRLNSSYFFRGNKRQEKGPQLKLTPRDHYTWMGPTSGLHRNATAPLRETGSPSPMHITRIQIPIVFWFHARLGVLVWYSWNQTRWISLTLLILGAIVITIFINKISVIYINKEILLFIVGSHWL